MGMARFPRERLQEWIPWSAKNILLMAFCKIFIKGEGGASPVMCKVKLEGNRLVAVEHRPPEGRDPQLFELDLSAAEFEFGGADHSQLVFKTDSYTLYAERADLEPQLKSLNLMQVSSQLQQQGQVVGGLRRRAWMIGLGLIVGILLVLKLCLVAVDWGLERTVDAIPVSWEKSLGEIAIPKGDVVEDPAVTGPVQEIVDRLLAAEPNQPYEFNVRVLRDPAINAMAAPGGEVIVFTGLLEAAEQPEEVAGVLAHEIQHVLHRHSLKGLAHRLKWAIAISLVVGDVSSVQEAILAKAPLLLELSFGRDMERQADTDGVALLQRAKIDPRGLKTFFERLQKEQGDLPGVLKFISTHPLHEERIDYIDGLTKQLPVDELKALDVNWEGLKEALKGVKDHAGGPGRESGFWSRQVPSRLGREGVGGVGRDGRDGYQYRSEIQTNGRVYSRNHEEGLRRRKSLGGGVFCLGCQSTATTFARHTR